MRTRQVTSPSPAWVVSFFLLVLAACDKPSKSPLEHIETFRPYPTAWFLCGDLGEARCHAPGGPVIPSLGHLVACSEGLGCDVRTDTCVKPCGGTGQVCCDGPETRAPKWTADGRVFSPNYINMREMCDAGACDRQSHRCESCGTRDGAACCPPDQAQATAFYTDTHLECEYQEHTFYQSGTCRACGQKGKAPCRWGCDPGLELRQGLCAICGGEDQPPCDRGCNAGLGIAQGLCRRCGAAGQIPCDQGCRYPLKVQNGFCAACGATGQAPCDSGCEFGTTLINGVCTRSV
jgi:hypothetical protein